MEVDNIQLRFEPAFPTVESPDARRNYCLDIYELLFGDSDPSSRLSHALLESSDRTDEYFENLFKRHDFADPIPVAIWDYNHEWIPNQEIDEKVQCAQEALNLQEEWPGLFVLAIDLEKKEAPCFSFHLFYRGGPAPRLLPPFRFPWSAWRKELERRLNGNTPRFTIQDR